MKSNKKTYIYLINVIIFFIFLLLSIFFDFEISKNFALLAPNQYYSSNIFPIIIEVFGESVMFLLLGFAFSVFFALCQLKIKNKWQYFLCAILFIIIFFINFLMVHRVFRFLANYLDFTKLIMFVLLFLLGVIWSLAEIKIVQKIKPEILNVLLWFSVFVVLVIIATCLAVQLIKSEIFTRIRFRALNAINDYSFFTKWWRLENKSLQLPIGSFDLPADAFRSFPSGHAAAGATLFCFYALCFFIKKELSPKLMFCLYFFPPFFTFVIGLGRILAGAHYLSDVLAGVFLVWIIILINFFVVKYLMNYINKKTLKKHAKASLEWS